MRAIALTFALLFAASSCAQEPSPAELEWIRKQAIPLKSCEAGGGFEDLAPLKNMIGDAKIVSLGECTHGTREVFQMKHRLVEYLATELGFSIFSIEASMPESYRLNEYVLEGKGDVEVLIDGMYFWTWNTEEVKAMVEWMRAFNRSGKGRIEFTGFDMQTPDVAMKIVAGTIGRLDAGRAQSISETYAAILKASQLSGPEFGVATGSFPVEAARGKKIRYSGWIRTDGVTGTPPGLWWRADGSSGVLAFENSQERSATGTSDWKEHVIELAIPAETTNINFGATFPGQGSVWFDAWKIEIDGAAFDATGKLGLDFEGDSVEGFSTAGNGYSAALDAAVARTGKKSLKMTFTGAAASRPAMEAPEASRRAASVVEELESLRDRLIAATSKKEAEWAIQNARVVHQCFQMRANEVDRDVSMAQNVRWIFQQARPGARMILWAHNGHVSRAGMMGGASMGKSLDEWFGPDQFIIGFTAAAGEYTAVKQAKGLRSDNTLAAPPPGSVEDYLRRAGMPLFMIDLRKAAAAGEAAAWLRQPRLHLSIGALAMDTQHYRLNVPGSYDALIFIENTSATRLLERAGGIRR